MSKEKGLTIVSTFPPEIPKEDEIIPEHDVDTIKRDLHACKNEIDEILSKIETLENTTEFKERANLIDEIYNWIGTCGVTHAKDTIYPYTTYSVKTWEDVVNERNNNES